MKLLFAASVAVLRYTPSVVLFTHIRQVLTPLNNAKGFRAWTALRAYFL